MKRRNKSLLAIIMVLGMLAFLPCGASGATQELAEEAQQLQKLADNFFPRQMDRYHIPGAVIAIVRDGEVIVQKGYGYADLEEQKPVDPENTVFRIGSISKVFTATAVMQLYEKGLIKLDENINSYLKSFQIKNPYSTPVTLAHLLTHTAGFDETTDIGMRTYEPIMRLSLSERLKTMAPRVINEPGEIIRYSNFGNSLAGLIVQEQTGMPYEDYIKANIFEPLGMGDSDLELTEEVRSKLAKSYIYKNGEYDEAKIQNTGVMPSGSINATASDMTRFMIAQLQLGQYEGKSLLLPETAVEMQSLHAQDYPGFDGYAYGFYYTQGGLMHNGSLSQFNAYMCLLPEEDTGIFVAFNADSPEFLSQINSVFAWRYLTKYHNLSIEAVPFEGDIRRFEGSYLVTRHAQESIGKMSYYLPNMALAQMEVKAADNNRLVINGQTYEPRGPLVFKNVLGDEYLAFRTDGEGRITYLFSSGGGSWEKLPWFETYRVNMGLGGFFFLFYAVFLIALIASLLLRRLRPNTGKIRYSPVSLKYLSAGVCLVYLIFVAGLYLISMNLDITVYKLPLVLLLTLPFLAVILMLVLVYRLFKEKRRGTLTGKIAFWAGSLLTVSVLFLLYLNYWKLLGFRLYT